MKKIISAILFISLLLFSSCEKKENVESSGYKPDNTEDFEPGDSTTDDNSSDNNDTLDDEGITYQQRVDRLLEGASFSGWSIIDTYKNNVYNNEKIVSNAIYASPNGNGEGSINDPYSLEDALYSLKPGDTLYLRGGIYDSKDMDGYFIEKSGNKNNFITIRNYPNEKPVITNSYVGKEAYGIQVCENTAYVIFEGIEISNITSKNAFGIVFWGDGQNHIIIRNCDINNIKTNSNNPESDSDAGANGILLMGEATNPISDVVIASNYVHDNVTGWCESISVASNAEYIYVLDNTVSNNTNIGIDFYGNASYCNNDSLDQPRYVVASGNTVDKSKCSYADCAGIYVDGARDVIIQYNKVTNSQYGIEIGSEERKDDYPVKNILVRNNICSNNSEVGIRIGGYQMIETGVVMNVTIDSNTFYNNSTEVVLSKCSDIEFVNNVFLTKNNILETDFSKDYTKNISFNNNLLYIENASNPTFYIYNSNVNGIEEFNNLFGNNIYQEFIIDDSFKASALINSVNTLNKYDYYLNERKNYIGAVN